MTTTKECPGGTTLTCKPATCSPPGGKMRRWGGELRCANCFSREYRRADPGPSRRAALAWQAANPEEKREYGRAYRAANPGWAADRARRSRARRRAPE